MKPGINSPKPSRTVDLEMAEQLFRAGMSTGEASFRLGIGPNKVRELRKKMNFAAPPTQTNAMRQAVKMGWQAMVNRKKRAGSFIPDAEIDAMVAAYAKPITHCPPMGALGDIPPEVE